MRIVKLVSRAGAVAVMAAAVVLMPLIASAHEEREVDNGKYTLLVGFLNEPTITGQLNSLDLRVADNSQPATPTAATAATGDDEDALAGAPVVGLEDTLQVEVIYQDKKKTLTLLPRPGVPGAYNAYLIPTAAGDYSFHIFGTINGDQIDETFTSSPQGMDSVEDAATYQFP